MEKTKQSLGQLLILLAADFFVLVIVTVIGFASHETLDSAGTRMLTTLLPLFIAWIAIAPFLGLYNLDQISKICQIWRAPYAALIAAPLAAFLRGVILGTPVLLVFVAILGGVSAVAMLIWRGLYLLIVGRVKP
jgi:hypothetical protein